MKKGKLIVIDGTDGSGKATQVELLRKRFVSEKIKVKSIDFPRYYHNFFGKLVGECLAGKYGDWSQVDSHIASVLYAADRWESSVTIKKWLDTGYTVIVDRYVSSSQIHQGGKINDAKERKAFLLWLDTMEYKVFEIPKPSVIIFLDVPLAITQELLKAKNLKDKKKYLEGKGDSHETNPTHLANAKKSASKLVSEMNNWFQINCASGLQIKTREAIHEDVYKIAKKILRK